MTRFKRFQFFSALCFLFFLILMAIFPQAFTNKDPDEQRIQTMPPNSGLNKVYFLNNSDFEINIDSLIFIYSYFNNEKIITQALIKNLIVKKNQTVSQEFKMENLNLEGIQDITIILYSESEAKEIILKFNKFKKEFILRKKGNTFSRIIKMFEGMLKERSVFGTDDLGRDIWSRFVYGTQIILEICLYSLLISVPLGIIIGLFRGYFDNKVSSLLKAISELANSAPVYLLAMLIVSVSGHKIINIVIAFSLVQWIEIDKLIYERVSELKKKDFILSAKLFGKTDINIIFTELCSLCFPQIVIGSIFIMARMVLIESSLSFLGYSVTTPNSSWGSILSSAENYGHIFCLSEAWWMVLLPSVAIILTIFSLNSIGNFLKERMHTIVKS